jgi:hypothetical protein
VLLPSPPPTLPPLIVRTTARPLCSTLRTRIQPALGLMIQNDATIAKSPAYFQSFITRTAQGSGAGRDIAVLRLESLVQPLVHNTLAVQALLENPAVFPAVARNADEKKLIAIKTAMLRTLAAQEASLDIINGFVTTEQLAQMQDVSDAKAASSPSPMPDHPDNFDALALHAGLSPNPYQIDPTTIANLSLAANPISRLKDGILWTQSESKKEAQPLAQAVIESARECSAAQFASPSPKP